MRRWIPLLVSIWLGSGTAHAATLSSAPASAKFAGAYLECFARNAGSTPREITIEMLDFSGGVVFGPQTPIVAPGKLEFLIDNSLSIPSSSCRFRFSGSAKNVRAH